MALRPGDSFAAEFHVHSASGALANADSAPTGTLIRNSVADATPTITVANTATGIYRVSGTVPAGYAAGDVVQVRITATVGGESTSGLVELGVLDGARVAEVFARIGAGGGGLSAIPWNSAWNNQVQAEAEDALAAYGAATSAELLATRIRSATAQAGGASTITLDAAASATDDLYAGALVFIRSGAGAGQARVIIDYVGATKVATVDVAWATAPGNDSVFDLYPGSPVASLDQVAAAVLREPIGDHDDVVGSVAEAIAQGGGGGGASASEIADALLDEALAGHTTAGTVGERLGRIPNAAAGASGGLPRVEDLQPAAAAALTAFDPPTRAELASDIASLAQYIDTEVAAILEDTGTTLPALFGALNDLDATAAQAAAAAALAAYDPPTMAELQAVQTAVSNLIAGLNDAPDLSTQVGDIQAVTARLSAMLEDVNGDRWTSHALEQAPTGEGGGDSVWTTEGMNQVRADSAAARVASEAAVSDIGDLAIPPASEVASAVRSELAAELLRLDVAISTRASAGNAMTLTSAERSALAGVILGAEDATDGVSLQELIRLVVAWIAGRVTGADGDGAQLTFQNPAGTRNRIVVTVDEHGNRPSPATLDLT